MAVTTTLRVFMLCVLAVASAACTRTRVITERVPLEVPKIEVVVVPDSSFAKAYSSLMEDVFSRPYSLDTLSARATRSDTLRAISIDLQYHRILMRTLKRFWLQL